MSRRFLAKILLAVLALAAVTSVIGLLPDSTVAAPTIMTGDWEIDNGDVVTRTDEEIHLTGDLIVHDGGLLTFRNVTLKMDSDSSSTYSIVVEDGGRFNIYDEDGDASTTDGASLITALDTSYNYIFYVEDGGELYFNHSDLQECGRSSGNRQELGLWLGSSSCSLRELNITDCYVGLVMEGASPTVADCTVNDSTSYGIYMVTCSSTLDTVTVDTASYGIITSGGAPNFVDLTVTSITNYGIYLSNSASDVIDCTVTDCGSGGIYTNSNVVDISGCTIDDFGAYGILSYWSTLSVVDCTVNDGLYGMYLYRNAAGSSVSGGKVGNCTTNGIYVYLSTLVLDGVEVHDSTTNGLYLYRTSGNSAVGCLVEDAAVGLFLRDSTSTITDLTVVGGTSHGIDVAGGTPAISTFTVTGSGNGLTAESTTRLRADNGTISSSTTRDVNVASAAIAELTSVDFTTSQVAGASSALGVFWFVDLHGIWQDGSDVAGGSYTVTDQASATVASGTLDGGGWARWLRIQESETTSSGTTTYTPHTFTVGSGGLTGLAAATVDTDRTVTVTVTDNVPPSGYGMNGEPAHTQGTTNVVSWTAGSDTGVGGIEYYCQMATDAGFASVVYGSGWTPSTTYTFIGLSDGVTYHFRVQARDSVGNVGAWSSGVSSTQDSSPPSVPVVVGEPAYTLGTTNTVTWGTSTDGGIGSVDYSTQYTDDPTFNTVLGTTAWQTTTSRAYSGLSDGTTYLYRVRARDGFGQTSAWSSPVSSTQDASPPSTPSAVTLPTYTQGLSVTFQWLATTDAGVGGVEYYAEVDTQSWFPSPDGSSGWTTDLQHTFNGLPENTWHYYRVRARDALWQTSGWSTLTWTRNDNTAPTSPVITVEPTYTAGTENTVAWSASSDGSGVGGIEYRVETDTSAAFTSPDFSSGWQTSRSYTFSSLVDGQTYHYRVRARDALDQEGSWSAIQSSTQDASPPPVPGIATEPVHTAGTTNTIEWTEVTDAGVGGEQYQVQIDDAPSFATPLATSGWTTLTSYTFSGLSDGTTYHYRVRSRDSFAQVSDWSGTTSSTQDSSAPPAPTMKQADWYNSGLYFVAEWTAVSDTGVGGVEYYCEYDDLSNFASPNGNSGWTTALEHNFTGLQENRWYYYHVRARDALGQMSTWSAYIFARQDNTPPTIPVMTAEPAWTAGTTNTVSWSASTDTGGIWQIAYQVEIDTDTSFNPPLQTSPWITSRSYTFTGLQDGVTYYYHARARDGLLQESTWSAMVASTQDASPPPAPTMATEPAYTQGTSNTVSWTAVTDNSGGTVSYRVVASLSSVFATTEGDSGWRTTATWTFSGLADGSTYHYRVKARDQYGQEGAWSNIVSSTQDATAPSGYYMLAEPTYTQGTTNTVEWNPATDSGSGGVEYQVEVWTISTTSWITGTSYTFTGLPENTYIYYRVRARDAVGNTGGWSSWIYSRQDNSPPAVPTMTPLAQYTQGTAIDVGWSASSDGAGIGQVTYKAQYAATGSFSPVLGESLWQSQRTYTFSGLSDGQTYYFRARARDGLDQESGWSGWVSTTMDSQAPPAPFLASEPPFTAGTSNSLSWTAVTDGGSGNVQYELQASTVPSFASIAATSGWIPGTSHTFTGLTDGTLYYYRVHARDGLRQEGPWSNVERSTQDASAPAAPTIVSEPTYTAGSTNTLYWSAVTDATSGGVEYYVEYDNDWQFRSPNGASGWISATEHTFTGLAENTWWYYHVRARDAVGNLGAWSGLTWSRQDDTAPTVPVMTAEPTHTAGTTNTLGWSASTDTGGVWGITYSAESSLNSNFATVLATSPWTSSTSWTFSGLTDGWTYYYRVRARDALDHISSYSNVVLSTQDASAPPAPFLTAEPEYTSGTANQITWTAVSDGGVGNVEYEAQRSTTPAFTSVVSSGWLRGTTFTFTGLADGTLYYYRVHAQDGFGQAGPWSNVERSTQDNAAPSVPNLPVLDWPQPGSQVSIRWDASTDAGVGGIEYWAEVDTDFLFRSPDASSGWTTATEFTFTGLPENTWLFFRVRARDDFDHTSGWSSTRWTRLDDSPPTTPTMRIEPSYTPGTTNEVQWTASTDSGVGGVEYQVYVDDGSNMASPIAASPWQTGLSYTFSGLADGRTYWYAVRARDAFDHVSPLSNVVSSTQDDAAPSTPSMGLEPEFTQGSSNTLSWSAAEDAGVGGVLYTFQWSTSSVFSTVTGEFDRLDGTSAVASGLADGTRYHYRVRARDSFNHFTPWSNIVWSTQDASAPPVPTMKDEPEFTKGTSNEVAWSAVVDGGVGGVQYLHQLSVDGAFTNPIGTGWTTATGWTWNNLGDGSRYWYRVRARDAFGQQSAWSAFVSSTQDDRAPGVPTLAAEPTVTEGTTNTLSWSTVTDAGVGGVEYEVQASVASAFGTLHGTSGWTPATSHTFSGLSDGQTYHYRVRARDGFDHRSAWSAVRSSTQDNAPPSTPSMSAEPQFTQGLSNSVSWTAVGDAGIGGVEYLCQAATDGAFTDLVGSYGWGRETSATFTGLSDGQTYYYRVMARDGFDHRTPWSGAVWSTQDNSAPSRPSMTALPQYSQGTVLAVTWSLSIDTGIGGVTYYAEWDNVPTFPSPGGASGWVPVREWVFAGLPENQALYFRVRARDALGQASAWSTPVSTIMDNSPPSTPSLNELPEYTKGRAVSASWNPAVDLGVAGVEYYAQWDDDPAFATPGGSSDWVASATHTFGGLPEHVTVYFRVRARDGFGHATPWSGAESTICDGSPPSIPYLATEPLYTKGTTNTLTWSTSLDAGVAGVEYRVQGTPDPTWTTLDKDSGWLRATAHTFSGLADGVAYYYRVQARDSFAWTTAWSPVVTSTQDSAAPPVPLMDPLPPYTEGLEATVTWSSVLDAGVGGEQYMVEVSPVETFSTLVDSSPWTTGTTWTFTGLSEGAPLYYRVRSRDGFDQRSPWSGSVSTTQDASPPQVPFVNPEPEHTAGTDNTVEWLSSADAGVGGVQYWAEAAGDVAFSDVVSSSGWTSARSFTFRMLADGVTYHYRVRARDAFGHESGWSASVRSTQDGSPPEALFDPLPAVISSPVLEVTGTSVDAGSGVSFVELSDDGGATWTEAVFSSGSWSYTWTGYGSGTHELWVRATDVLDNSMPTPTVALATVDLDAPDASISSPAANETLTGLVPVQGTALDPHIARYNLYWSGDGIELTPIVEDQRLSVVGGTLAIWDTRTMEDGEYLLVLEVNDTSGRTTRTNVTVFLLNSAVVISPGDLTMSDPFPFKGDNVTISATFKNTGTSWARDVVITIKDNDLVLYEGVHNIRPGAQRTVAVPYKVPDHSKVHTITATAEYGANPEPVGNTASASYTGEEVVVEPFFDTSEWVLFAFILAVLVVLIALFFLVWKRMGAAPVVMGGALPVTTATFETMEPLGGDQIQWDDDSF